MKKTILTLSILLAFALVFTVTPINAETITFWHMFTEDDPGTEWVVDQYHAEQDEVEVDVRYVHFSEIDNQLMRALTTGDVPDVVITGSDVFAQWSSMGAFADITDRIEEWGYADYYYEGPMNSVMWEGRYYGLPQNVNALAMFMNVELFEEAGLDPDSPPKTWDEVKEYAHQLDGVRDNVSPIGFSATADETATFQFLPFLWQAGADIENFDSPEGHEALGYWKYFVDEGLAYPEVLSTPQWELMVSFAAGNMGMVVNGPWGLVPLEDAEFEYKAFMMPVHEDVGVPYSTLGGENIAILDGSDKQDAAWDFVKFTQREDIIEEWTGMSARIPGRMDVAQNSPYWTENEVLKLFTEQLEYAQPRGPLPNWSEVSSPIQRMIQEVLTGTDIEEAAREGQNRINSVLD